MKINKLLGSKDDFAAGTFVSGLFAGLLTGLAVGLLLAPESGKKTRKKMKRILVDQAKDVQDKLDDAKKDVQDKLDQAKKQAMGTIDTIKSAIKVWLAATRVSYLLNIHKETPTFTNRGFALLGDRV